MALGFLLCLRFRPGCEWGLNPSYSGTWLWGINQFEPRENAQQGLNPSYSGTWLWGRKIRSTKRKRITRLNPSYSGTWLWGSQQGATPLPTPCCLNPSYSGTWLWGFYPKPHSGYRFDGLNPSYSGTWLWGMLIAANRAIMCHVLTLLILEHGFGAEIFNLKEHNRTTPHGPRFSGDGINGGPPVRAKIVNTKWRRLISKTGN